MKLNTMDVKVDLIFFYKHMTWKRNARVRESGGAAVLTCCYSDASWSLQRIKLFKKCSSLFKTIHS